MNVIVMACESFRQSLAQQQFLAIADVLFNMLFAAEVVLKLTALYPIEYFKSTWNRFDFVVVMVSFLGILFDLQGASFSVNPTILRVSAPMSLDAIACSGYLDARFKATRTDSALRW